MRFLERDFPALRPRMEKLYRRKSVPEAYRKEVKAMVHVLQRRYGMARRGEAGTPAVEAYERGEFPEETQVGFAW